MSLNQDRFSRPFSFAILVLCVFTLAAAHGCAPRNMGSANPHQKREDQVRTRLLSIEVSPEHSIASESSRTCNPDEAAKMLDLEIEPSVKESAKWFASCGELYACSPSAMGFLKRAALSPRGTSLRIGFADMQALDFSDVQNSSTVQQAQDYLGGFYLSGTNHIYLDTVMKTPRQLCAMLLHEMVHRFNPQNYDGDTSAVSEFEAYWVQFAFSQELALDKTKLGEQVRSKTSVESTTVSLGILQYDRSIIAELINRYYGSISKEEVESFPKLPAENEGSKADK
ncbi:MAG: hypothetical protein AB1540_05465 [Bdellovibrionota bacterium]